MLYLSLWEVSQIVAAMIGQKLQEKKGMFKKQTPSFMCFKISVI